VAVLPGLREGWDAELAAMLGEESDPTLRQAVTWTLRHAGAEAGLAGLRVALQDPAANVRAEAARSLGWRSDGAELQVELRQALFDAEANVRAMAARSLGWRGVTLAAGEISGLVADADADVRLHALRALRRLDLPRARALPALGRLLADPDPRVARVARSVTAN
jgi:HEAT repeat protein